MSNDIFSNFPEELLEEVSSVQEEEDEFANDPFYKKRSEEIDEYLKVGLFCGWNLNEFDDTSLLDREIISKKIDERLKPYIEQFQRESSRSGKAGKALMPLDFNHLAILLALATFSSGGDE